MFVSNVKQCSMYRCIEQISRHSGTKRLQNKLVATLKLHKPIDHQADRQVCEARELQQVCLEVALFPNAHYTYYTSWPRTFEEDWN